MKIDNQMKMNDHEVKEKRRKEGKRGKTMRKKTNREKKPLTGRRKQEKSFHTSIERLREEKRR